MARTSKKASPELTPSRRSDAYERILLAIIFGDIEPGTSADEKKLARDLGLGLAVVRDALSRLALEGMVERHARIGTRVPELSLRALQEVFETRVVLEGAAAALAADRASPQDIAAMREAFDGVEGAIRQRDHRRVVAMDRLFHQRLAAATRNSHIERSLLLLQNNALRFWYFGLTRLDPDMILRDIQAHFAVVDAIEARDPDAAANAMRGVIGIFPENMKFFLGGGGALSDTSPLAKASLAREPMLLASMPATGKAFKPAVKSGGKRTTAVTVQSSPKAPRRPSVTVV